MERKPPSSIGDFVAVLRRRKYWIVVPFIVIVVLGVLIAPKIPRTYQSTATLMLVPQKVSARLVGPLTGNDLANRIQRIELNVMSSPDLVDIVQRMNLYPKLREKAKMSQVVAAMSKNITIAEAPDASDGRGGVNAFTISYIGHAPQEAQAVTNALANVYIKENLKQSRQDAQGATAFLSSQLDEAGKRLSAQEARIQAFKTAHLSSLPETSASNIQLIGQYQADLQNNRAAIDQDNQRRVYLQSVLNVSPSGGGQNAATPAPPSALEIQLAQDQAALQADLLKYTAEYPEVVRLKQEIAELQRQIREAPKSKTRTAASIPAASASGPSQNDQLRGELIALNEDIRTRQVRQKQVEQKIDALQKNISVVPAVQTQFASLENTYKEMQDSYNRLLAKQQEAEMAAALNRSDGSEQFTVIKPANLPTAPYRPNPIVIYMGSALVGLLFGFVAALLVELRDDTMHSTDEVAAYLKLPVIAGLPVCRPFSGMPWKSVRSKG